MVCITPQSQVIKIKKKPLLCASHSCFKLCSVHPSAESSSPLYIPPLSQNQNLRLFLVTFKGQAGDPSRGKQIYPALLKGRCHNNFFKTETVGV